MCAQISNYNNRHLHTKQRQMQKEFLEIGSVFAEKSRHQLRRRLHLRPPVDHKLTMRRARR